jgi:hypothetical protein
VHGGQRSTLFLGLAYARIIVEKCFNEEREELSAEQQRRFGYRPAHCGEAKVH